MKGNNLDASGEWFKKGDDDLSFAKAGYRETKISSIACFLCQQAVEKYLKGYLTFNSIKPEQTHILPKLLVKASNFEEKFADFLDYCDILTSYYIPSRYPAYVPEEYSEKEVQSAFQMAEDIIRFVKENLPEREW